MARERPEPNKERRKKKDATVKKGANERGEGLRGSLTRTSIRAHTTSHRSTYSGEKLGTWPGRSSRAFESRSDRVCHTTKQDLRSSKCEKKKHTHTEGVRRKKGSPTCAR